MSEMLRVWSIDDIMAEGPCDPYTRELIAELFAGRETVTLKDILQMDIPELDKIWMCARNHPLRDRWLEMVVARAIRNHALRCGLEYVETWAKKWLSGEDRSNACAAAAAANAADAPNAANAADAAYAAYAAAYAAANAADATACAAYAAANAAYAPNAADAAAYAADAKELTKQVEDMRSLIEEVEDGN